MSTEEQQAVHTDTADVAAETRARLIDLVEPQLDAPADTYAVVEDGDHAFVLAAWRGTDAVVHSARFGCRLDDETVLQVGVRNTHHIDESVETETWAQEFLHGREDRALKVARAGIDWEERPSRRPFDGPYFGAGF